VPFPLLLALCRCSRCGCATWWFRWRFPAFIIIFLYQPVKVEGTSMMPSLDDQERIFVNKYVYRLEPIQRGDIVVFRYPRDPSKSFIKRVIGLAGDRIRIDSGEVFVNGEALEEDYVPAAYADQRSYSEMVVPPNSYFVLGDHRTMSNDSRDFGPLIIGYIYGKAVLDIGPWIKWEECVRQLSALSYQLSVNSKFSLVRAESGFY
jgi:signal peptidase I